MAASALSKNVLKTVWLAWAEHQPSSTDRVEQGLERVQLHYQETSSEPLRRRVDQTSWAGLALWSPEQPTRQWPMWVKTPNVTMATTGVPTGWERITGRVATESAPCELAEALNGDPTRSFELNPPLALALHDQVRCELVIAGDVIGAGRLFEMRTQNASAWSNRLGALPILLGLSPSVDAAAWRLFAAAGWFMGSHTPIAEASKVPPGTLIRVRRGRSGAEVEYTQTDALRRLVEPRRARLSRSAEAAAAQAMELAREIPAGFDAEPSVSLTGGRDSRISAAATVSAGVAAIYNTGDQVPGELDVVRSLVSAAPLPMWHEVHRIDAQAEPNDDLLDRAAEIHLVHDGMRNPQELRRTMDLPMSGPVSPSISGHGGELGHGFYYHDRKQLRRLRRGGDTGLMSRLDSAARRHHSAAIPAAYVAYTEECQRTLDQGRAYGLRGAALLDWFYLAQRLSYRSGLGAREGRYSACATPAFVRGCFDLKPVDRLTAKLHRLVIDRLVPGWSAIPFFSTDSAPMPEIHRRRIWERPREAAVLGEVLARDGSWTEIFDSATLRRMWREVMSESGSADYEHVFYRVIYRESFDQHLRRLSAGG